jgi:methylthioribose-1-phosphate isomerase
LIEEIAAKKPKGSPVNILTHCNAGWLAFVDYGSATAPIYAAHDRGINVHVYVGETRPRNQGAALTAWELQKHGVPHTGIRMSVTCGIGKGQIECVSYDEAHTCRDFICLQ